jgi:hypothetical protein
VAQANGILVVLTLVLPWLSFCRPGVVVILLMSGLVPLSIGAQTSLDGQHFDITVIHQPPAIDVGLDDGAILANSQWSGYIIDMIDTISSLANFSYTLHVPSGTGSACHGGAASDWARQYVCGQQDVLSSNVTDAYWSQYYITRGRLNAGTLFSTPFLTNVGMTLATPGQSSQGFVDKLKKSAEFVAKPMSAGLWAATMLIIFVLMMCFWYIEQLQHPMKWAKKQMKYFSTDVNPNEMETSLFLDRERGGWLTFKSLWHQSAEILASTLGTLTMHTNPSQAFGDSLSKPGLLLNAVWCFWVLVWTSGYTANLAAILVADDDTGYSTVSNLAEARGTACVLDGAAYVPVLRSIFPTINLVLKTGGLSYLDGMNSGECDAIIDTAVSVIVTLKDSKCSCCTSATAAAGFARGGCRPRSFFWAHLVQVCASNSHV